MIKRKRFWFVAAAICAMLAAASFTAEGQKRRTGVGLKNLELGGGKTLEVIEVPGHTAGSIMFLDAADRTLAVGDAIGSGSYVWMFIPGTPPLTEYRDTLKRLEKRLAAHNSLTFLVGHHWQERTPLAGKTGKQMVTDMRILCEKVISGEIVGTSGSTNLGQRKINYRTAQYGLAGMWYDPEKIKAAN